MAIKCKGIFHTVPCEAAYIRVSGNISTGKQSASCAFDVYFNTVTANPSPLVTTREELIYPLDQNQNEDGSHKTETVRIETPVAPIALSGFNVDVTDGYDIAKSAWPQVYAKAKHVLTQMGATDIDDA